MRCIWYALLILLLAAQCVNADDKDPNGPNEPNDPKELLQANWDAILSVIGKKDADQQAKEKEITKIVNPIFDFQVMAQLSLGRTHWPKLTPPQREQFTKLFTERLVHSYMKKVILYTNETIIFKTAVPKKNERIIYIPVELISKDKKINMLYKLRKTDPPKGEWKIYDVEIQSVSILLTYRAQFDDILRNGTIKDILSQLEKPTES